MSLITFRLEREHVYGGWLFRISVLSQVDVLTPGGKRSYGFLNIATRKRTRAAAVGHGFYTLLRPRTMRVYYRAWKDREAFLERMREQGL